MKFEIKLSKPQLDKFTTLLGFAVGVLTILMQNEYVPAREAGTIIGILTIAWGTLTNKPAGAFPTTNQVENRNIREG